MHVFICAMELQEDKNNGIGGFKMHPVDLMKEAVYTDVDFPGVITKQVYEYMKDVHPSQFIEVELESVLYEVEVYYFVKGKRTVTTKKYMYLQYHDDVWMQIEILMEDWAKKENMKGREISDVNVVNISAVAKAVLKVG